VETVEVANEALKPSVVRSRFQQVPVEAAVVIPLAALPESGRMKFSLQA
jgi:hypothetical protein